MMSDKNWRDAEMFDELYQIICDVVCVPRKTIRIAGEEYPYSIGLLLCNYILFIINNTTRLQISKLI